MAITTISTPNDPSFVYNRIRAVVQTDQYIEYGSFAQRELKFMDLDVLVDEYITFSYNNKILAFTGKLVPANAFEFRANPDDDFDTLLDFVEAFADSLLSNIEWYEDFEVVSITEVASFDVRLLIKTKNNGLAQNFTILNPGSTDIAGLSQTMDNFVLGLDDSVSKGFFFLAQILHNDVLIAELDAPADLSNQGRFDIQEYLEGEFDAIPRYAALEETVYQIDEFSKDIEIKVAEITVAGGAAYGPLTAIGNPFRVFFGHMDYLHKNLETTIPVYITATSGLKFLTNQPRRKVISATQPDALYLYRNMANISVQARMKILTYDGDGTIIEGATVLQGLTPTVDEISKVIISVPCGFANIDGLQTHHDMVEFVYGYDYQIFFIDGGGFEVLSTEWFRFIVDHDEIVDEQVICFKEDMPSVGYVRATGEIQPKNNFDRDEIQQIDSNPGNGELAFGRNHINLHQESFKLSFGYSSTQEYNWLQELINTTHSWILIGGNWEPIRILNKKSLPALPGSPSKIDLEFSMGVPSKGLVLHA